jgi:soluble lytic murein transglycosylase-like protein
MTTKGRDIALAAALAVGIGGGPVVKNLGARFFGAAGSTDAAPVAAPVDRAALADRETILRVVRLHRRSSSDAWCARLADAVYEEARRADVDPLLVASIVARESSFRSRAVSQAGAVGLMQIRPFVAEDVATSEALDWNGVETLHDPAINVRLGVSYYKQLLTRFGGDERMALTAYNVGPTRVSLAVQTGTFRANRYARDVLDLFERLATTRAGWAALRPATVAPRSSDPV